ncbi:hypothetical protein BMI_I211 [Brucella microti CCM 4915]|uniref:Uncharacterized protein n=3 Tax=Brucella TaxID=234 RepID=A0A0H3AQU4_BRUO2|nr:hypothetical protein BOV_0200 [Brucella ovis ATCC 25840]ACU47226.1 hypothetical protein BMI_I211 [Brucella microti CCM 4915]ADZ86160.1 conserved hypothetical protein [Brucella melitensis M5-90]AEK53523.1 hypothetical protein BPI_I209 [Brucella pinnipedialis B2/94]EEH15440.1 Hypothetical protein, conserved [Brucella ceti str. Cudo]EFG37195.1 hypothetical protein BAZG_00516 [Brucella sp. NVSL 07-0026]
MQGCTVPATENIEKNDLLEKIARANLPHFSRD